MTNPLGLRCSGFHEVVPSLPHITPTLICQIKNLDPFWTQVQHCSGYLFGFVDASEDSVMADDVITPSNYIFFGKHIMLELEFFFPPLFMGPPRKLKICKIQICNLGKQWFLCFRMEKKTMKPSIFDPIRFFPSFIDTNCFLMLEVLTVGINFPCFWPRLPKVLQCLRNMLF